MDEAKKYSGLLTGLMRRMYMDDSSLSNETLQEELYSDLPAEGQERASHMHKHVTCLHTLHAVDAADAWFVSVCTH